MFPDNQNRIMNCLLIISLFLIAMMFFATALNAEEITATVDPDGTGDYENLNAALGDLEADLTDDGGDTVVITCICTDGTPDTTPVVFGAGWVTSADYDIVILTSSEYRHSGTYQTGNKYRLEPASGVGIDFTDGGTFYITIDGIQLGGSPTTGFDLKYAYQCIVSNCIIKGAATGVNSGGGSATNSVNHLIYNNIIYDCSSQGIYSPNIGSSGRNTRIYNNTIYGCATGINAAKTLNPDTYAINNIVQDCTTCYSGSEWDESSKNNCSDDDTQPGASGQNGSVLFVDESGDDFYIQSGDTVAKDNGLDLSDSTWYGVTITTDIGGETRVAPWDIGADEYTADTTTPETIDDFANDVTTNHSVGLTWTAPGDDAATGTATSYDIRYSTVTITDDNWGDAVQATDEPTPSIAGTTETYIANGLYDNITYYFGIKSTDDESNESELSNIATATTNQTYLKIGPENVDTGATEILNNAYDGKSLRVYEGYNAGWDTTFTMEADQIYRLSFYDRLKIGCSVKNISVHSSKDSVGVEIKRPGIDLFDNSTNSSWALSELDSLIVTETSGTAGNIVTLRIFADCSGNEVYSLAFTSDPHGGGEEISHLPTCIEWLNEQNETKNIIALAVAGDLYESYRHSSSFRYMIRSADGGYLDDDIPIVVAVGNHDVDLKSLDPLDAAYWWHSQPHKTMTDRYPHLFKGKEWYTWDYGDKLRIIVCNNLTDEITETYGNCYPNCNPPGIDDGETLNPDHSGITVEGSEQRIWLDSVSASSHHWKIAMFHRPIYSPRDGDVGRPLNQESRPAFLTAIQNGLSLYLQGDQHLGAFCGPYSADTVGVVGEAPYALIASASTLSREVMDDILPEQATSLYWSSGKSSDSHSVTQMVLITFVDNSDVARIMIFEANDENPNGRVVYHGQFHRNKLGDVSMTYNDEEQYCCAA